MAVFKAWRDQKSIGGDERDQKKTLQAKINSLSKSNIQGTIDWAVLGQQPENGSHVGMIVSLRNSGAGSAIDPGSWSLTVTVPSGDKHYGKPNTLLDKNLDFCLGANAAMRFVRNDALYLKTASVLPMNGTTQGFIWFSTPDLPKSSLVLPETLLTLNALSITGQDLTISIKISELSEKSKRTRFFSGIENPRPLAIPCKENQPY